MKKSSLWKKIVSILLASAMVLTAVPVSAGGFETAEDFEVLDEMPLEGEAGEDRPGTEQGFTEEVPEAGAFQVSEVPEAVEGFVAAETLKAGDFSSWFNGGNGTQESPYLISTAEQIKKIYDVYLADMETDYYYKLQNDIDLSTSSHDYTLYGYGVFAAMMRGELDGAGYTVFGAKEYQALIGYLYGTVKNLTWHVETPAALVAMTKGVSVIENVVITGYVKYVAGHGNEAPLLYVNDGEKLTLKNVTNRADIEAYGAALYNGIFIGYTGFMYDSKNPQNSPRRREYVFESCVNEGTVIGDKIAMFFGNATNMEEALNGTLKHEGDEKKELAIAVTNCSNTGSITGIEDARYLAATMGDSTTLLNDLENDIVSNNPGLTKAAPYFQIANVGNEYKFEVDGQGNGKISIGNNASGIAAIEVNLITYVNMFKDGVFAGTDRHFIQETIPVTQGVNEYRSPLKLQQITDDGSGQITYTGTDGHIPMINGKYYFEPSDTYQIGRTFGTPATTTPSIFQVNLYDASGALRGVLSSAKLNGTLDEIPSINAAIGESIGSVSTPTEGAAWLDGEAVVIEGGQILWEKNGTTLIPVQVNGVWDLDTVELDATEISLAPGAEIELLAEIPWKEEGVTYNYTWASDDAYITVTQDNTNPAKAIVRIDAEKTVVSSAVVTVTVSSNISSKEVTAICKVNVTSIAAQVPKIDKDSDITNISTPIAGVEKGAEANSVKKNLEELTQDIVETGSPFSEVFLTTSDGKGTTEKAAQAIQDAAKEENAKIVTVVHTEHQEEGSVDSDATEAIKELAESTLGQSDGTSRTASYLDISISVNKVSDQKTEEIAKITELPKNQALPITVALPNNLQKKKVIVFAYHDGKAMQITNVVQKDGFLSFPAHLFSPYALMDAGDKFTVNFDTAGGPKIDSQEVEYGGLVVKPADPAWSSHIFQGWYEDADCENPWDFGENTITGDVTIYAKWSYVAPPAPATYTVTFDSQGGSPVAAISGISGGTVITPPAAPAKEGYDFGGWYTDTACTNAWDFAAGTVTADMTLYAKWTAKEPGEKVPAPVTVTVDSKTTNTVKISWTESAGADGYTLWTRAEGETAYARRAIIGKDAARTYTWKNRKPGTKYYFVVKAWIQDEAGKYVFSEASKTVRATMKPKAAKIKRAVIDKDGNLKVILDGAAAGANRYAMCWSKNADFSKYRIGIRTQYTTRTIAKGLKAGTCYVRVRSYRQLTGTRVYGDWSEIVKVTKK